MRVSALHVWPELRNALATPSVTASCNGASSRITLADLPPSSQVTGLTVCDASSLTRLPARVEPVNETASTPGWAAIASPTTGPNAVTRLNTPAGRPSSAKISADTKALSGTTSDGLSTTVHPAAMAGATLAAIWCSG